MCTRAQVYINFFHYAWAAMLIVLGKHFCVNVIDCTLQAFSFISSYKIKVFGACYSLHCKGSGNTKTAPKKGAISM